MKKKNLAFTVELLGLFILLILVITVITQVFVMSRAHSLEARQLTEAVIIAESTAEVSSSEKNVDKLTGMIGAMDNAAGEGIMSPGSNNSDGSIWAGFSFDGNTENKDFKYVVEISRHSDASEGGVYAEDVINVYSTDDIIEASGVIAGDGDELISRLAAMGSTSGDGDITEDGSTAGMSLPEPVYTLTAGIFFGEDK